MLPGGSQDMKSKINLALVLFLVGGAGCQSYQKRPLDLTAYEFAILRALAERAGRPVTRDQLRSAKRRGAGR